MPPIATIALVCAALFTGAAGYISLVEHPVRLGMEDAPMLAQWQPSYSRALPIQSGLAIAGGLSGIVSWYLSGDLFWLLGSVVLLANWPFTLLAIMPTNKRLKTMQPAQANGKSRALLLSWGKLHNIRSALGLISTMIFAWTMTTNPQALETDRQTEILGEKLRPSHDR
mgnify:CR=1 FL=1